MERPADNSRAPSQVEPVERREITVSRLVEHGRETDGSVTDRRRTPSISSE
ncbi:hypothetical protein [Streptomyces sp. NPDC058665]|uniref:hypothetical protein n=1 Tax=Streptomyces sp. NPDC058665 TaxID=3346586 RepID=UPI00365A3599